MDDEKVQCECCGHEFPKDKAFEVIEEFQGDEPTGFKTYWCSEECMDGTKRLMFGKDDK